MGTGDSDRIKEVTATLLVTALALGPDANVTQLVAVQGDH